MIERTFHPSKTRNIVEYTGKIYDDEYVQGNNLSDDFNLTINDVASILDLAVPTVQTFIVPRLDVAKAGRYIRNYMGNNRLKIVVSRNSLIQFLGWYVNEIVYDSDTYVLSKADPKCKEENMSLEHIKLNEIHSILENGKRIQPFLNFAARYLEEVYFADYSPTQQEKEIKIEQCVKSVLECEVLSFNQLKAKMGFLHNEQVKRYLNKRAHIRLKLSSLDETGAKKRDNIRYILKPNINILNGDVVEDVDIEHGKPYFLNVFDKTKGALKNIETDYPVYVTVLHIISENIDSILPKFEQWEVANKKDKKIDKQ